MRRCSAWVKLGWRWQWPLPTNPCCRLLGYLLQPQNFLSATCSNLDYQNLSWLWIPQTLSSRAELSFHRIFVADTHFLQEAWRWWWWRFAFVPKHSPLGPSFWQSIHSSGHRFGPTSPWTWLCWNKSCYGSACATWWRPRSPRTAMKLVCFENLRSEVFDNDMLMRFPRHSSELVYLDLTL